MHIWMRQSDLGSMRFYVGIDKWASTGRITWPGVGRLESETRMLTVNKQLTRSGGELCISVPKTENSIRTIALPENTVALLIDEHNKHPDNPLMFWCPRTNGYWSPDSLRHLHKQMLAAAGVDESVRFHDLRHTFSTLAIQSGVDAKTVAGMLGHYSAAFTLDTYTHVTEQMKRGAAEKIGVFMNASVNVQVNVVHSPSAVVRGDYESDLANCLNPSKFDGFRSNITVDIEQGKGTLKSAISESLFRPCVDRKDTTVKALRRNGFAVLQSYAQEKYPPLNPFILFTTSEAHTFS